MLEHGEYRIKLVGNIIVLDLDGAFNENAVEGYCKLIKEKILTLKGKHFSILFDALNFQGATAGSYLISNKANEWLNGQNLIAKAWVANNLFHLELSKSYQPSLSTQNIRSFDNYEEAIQWLSEITI